MGMRIIPAELRYLRGRPAQLVRLVLAMNILGPIVTVLVCKAFSLHPAIIVALVTLSIAPVSNLFPQTMLPLLPSGRTGYLHGLFFASTVLSVVLTPLAVEMINILFAAEDEHANPLLVAKALLGSVLLPLGLGLAIGRWWPAARRWSHAIQTVGSVLLLVCAVPILIAAWPLMAAIYREGTLSAIVIITFIGLTVGHFLGGPDEDDRTVLAFATVTRHPGVAIAVGSLTDQPLAPVGVIVALLVNGLAVVPYKRWRQRRGAKGPPVTT